MKTNISNIEGIGIKFCGELKVTSKIKRKTKWDGNMMTIITLENDDHIITCSAETFYFRGDRYDSLSVGDIVHTQYNSWDGLVIKECDDTISDLAWSRMNDDEKEYFSDYELGEYYKYRKIVEVN